jgi:hypothetical protein
VAPAKEGATVAAWLGVHPRGGSVGDELRALENGGYLTMRNKAGKGAVLRATHEGDLTINGITINCAVLD